MNRKNKHLVYVSLGILQIFIGLGAVAGGIVLIIDPSGSIMGLPLDLLHGSPFPDYLIPGLFLFLINGVGSLLGSISTFVKKFYAGEIAVALGIILIVWIIIQVLIIEGFHWIHALYIGLGFLELLLGTIVYCKKKMAT